MNRPLIGDHSTAREEDSHTGLTVVLCDDCEDSGEPCTASRTPLGNAIVVGPVRTADDLAALAHWLESVPLTVTELPPRLRQIANQQHQTRRN